MPARNRFNPAHPKWTEDKWKQVFHFRKPDMDRLGAALHLPDDMHTPDRRKKWSGMEGLCVVLARLAYPNRLCSLANMFGRPKSDLSEIFNCTLRFISDEWQDLVLRIW
eukprot:scpid110033/ scgid24117/ 